ncbi:RNA polymerase sigma-H factor [Rhodocyclaceae bacterium]|nr:RNA polymerase sigma-H factor [Rhodocyclaceae bacterium]
MGILAFISRSRQFEEKLAESRPRLWRLARSWCRSGALADDLVQEAMAKALRNHGQLRDMESLQAWLCGILANCWHDHLRLHRNMTDIADVAEDELVAEGTPEDDCLQSQLVQRVRRAVAELPLGQREVVTLVDLEELSYADVAAVLAIPIGTVMSRLSRARSTLKEQLRRQETLPRLARIK